MRSDMLFCITALAIFIIYTFSSRYHFINEQGLTVSVGDKWTGCVTYRIPNPRRPIRAESCQPKLDELDKFLDEQ